MKSFSHHSKETRQAYVELCTNKKERILQLKNRNTLLRVKTLATVSLKVRHQNAKALTPNLQNVQLYSHGGVDDFTRLK